MLDTVPPKGRDELRGATGQADGAAPVDGIPQAGSTTWRPSSAFRGSPPII
jgi:hypothetical protein